MLSSDYFYGKRVVSGSSSLQKAALLPLSLFADRCSCVLGSGQVRVGGWCAELRASLQIICRLQVKCRSESIAEQELFFIFR